jgi:hypothetical protein
VGIVNAVSNGDVPVTDQTKIVTVTSFSDPYKFLTIVTVPSLPFLVLPKNLNGYIVLVTCLPKKL